MSISPLERFGPLPLRSRGDASSKFGIAGDAPITRYTINPSYNLEERLLSLVVTIGTYIMVWVGAATLWLYAVHKNTRWKLLKLVASLLMTPAFQCRVFFFEFVIEMRNRQILLLERKKAALQV